MSGIVTLKRRGLVKATGKGSAVVTREPISFLDGVDSKSGIIIEKGDELEGVNIAGRVLVFPHGKGSTVGSYVICSMAKMKTAPVAIVNREAETKITVGLSLQRFR